jgi:hypothetical protein
MEKIKMNYAPLLRLALRATRPSVALALRAIGFADVRSGILPRGPASPE